MPFSRAKVAPLWQVPPKEPQGQANLRAQKYLLKRTVFFVLCQCFFLHFLCYFYFLFVVFFVLSFFSDCTLFLFIRRKTHKNFKTQKQNRKKHSTHFLFENLAEREFLQPKQRTTRTGQSEGSKMTSKRHVKSAKTESKKRRNTTPTTTKKSTKIAKKHNEIKNTQRKITLPGPYLSTFDEGR